MDAEILNVQGGSWNPARVGEKPVLICALEHRLVVHSRVRGIHAHPPLLAAFCLGGEVCCACDRQRACKDCLNISPEDAKDVQPGVRVAQALEGQGRAGSSFSAHLTPSGLPACLPTGSLYGIPTTSTSSFFPTTGSHRVSGL